MSSLVRRKLYLLANDPVLLATVLVRTPSHNRDNVVRALRVRVIRKDAALPVDNRLGVNRG